jgi:hypothetical protein
MQRTADLHNQISHTRLPETADVMDDAAALNAAVDVLDTHAPTGNAPIRGLLRACELPSSRLPGRHDDLHPVEREGQEAKILEQPAPHRQGVRGGIGNSLVDRRVAGERRLPVLPARGRPDRPGAELAPGPNGRGGSGSASTGQSGRVAPINRLIFGHDEATDMALKLDEGVRRKHRRKKRA